MSKIVFLSSYDSELESIWMDSINQHLNDTSILLPHQISDNEAQEVEVAVVANADPDQISHYPNLVWIQSLWVGIENLVSYCANHKIKLVKLVDPQLAKIMAESVLAWTLFLQRNMHRYSQQQKELVWKQLPNVNSSDLNISVLGTGNLGIEAINTLKQLEFNISAWSRTSKTIDDVTCYSGSDGLSSMLGNTDILINLLPLTDETFHLLNERTLSMLPRGAKVVNFSRGAVLDSDALLVLLDSGHVEHAILDVFEVEPLPSTSIFWCHPQVTVLPHISAPTNMNSASKIVAENLGVYLNNGNIPDTVNTSKGY